MEIEGEVFGGNFVVEVLDNSMFDVKKRSKLAWAQLWTSLMYRKVVVAC